MGRIIRHRISHYTLMDIIRGMEQKFDYWRGDLEGLSYREVLNRIKSCSNTLYSQLNKNINYLFAFQDGDATTLLHLAAEYGDSGGIQKLLDNGADVNVVNAREKTPLYLAAEKGREKVVQKLLDNNADADVAPWSKDTPLHLAAQNGHLGIVQKLLDYDVNVDATNRVGSTPLCLAVHNGHFKVAELLLDNGANIDVIVNSWTYTMLHLAAQNGNLEGVKFLLSRGANTEMKDRTGNTPLHLAAKNGHEEVVQKLLDKNANTEAVNEAGDTPIQLAAKNKHIKVVQKLTLKEVPSESSEDEMEEDPFMKEALSGNNADEMEEDDDVSLSDISAESPDEGSNELNDITNNRASIRAQNQQINSEYLDSNDTRNPIPIFKEIQQETDQTKKQNLEGLLNELRSSYSNDLKIGAAIGKGDCFFDAVAQGLNELKDKGFIVSNKRFSVKSLREDCASYADEYKDKIIQDAEGGEYSIPLQGPYGPIQDPETKKNKIDNEETFRNYLEEIKKTSDESNNVIWGRSEIEGKMICEKYKVKIKVIELRNEAVDGLHVTTGEVGKNGNTIYIVNYKEHFVPLLSDLKQDVEQNQKISREEEDQLENNEEEMDETEYKLAPVINNENKMEEDQLGSNEDEMDEIEHASEPVIKNEDEVGEDHPNDIEYSIEDGLWPEDPHPLDEAVLNEHEVSVWEKPKISSKIEHDTPTRFDGQIILQLENDSVVMEAAVRLATKHPESSVVVQLDTQGNYQIVYGDFDVLEEKENLRWQVVGHGRTDKTLGGYSATALADKIADFTIELDAEYNISSSPKYISLVGCSLIDNVEMNYARELALSLDEQGIRVDVAARSARVAVTDAGKKLTEDSAGNWNYKISEDKVIYAWNEDGELVPQIGQRAVQLLKSVNLAQDFHQAMSELYRSNRLPEGKWLPILRNATENTKSGYPVEFVNAEQQLQTLKIQDQRIIDFIEDYNKKLAETKAAFDAESVDGLNSAFIVKTLIPWFANKSRMAVADDDVPEILKTALQVHTWINLAQMGHGAIEDIAKITKLYQVAVAVSEGKEVASEMISPIKSVVARTGPGVILNIASIVLDSIELANAQNEAQKAIYGTQLGFDTASLVLSGIGTYASLVGATTVAAFAGAGGVILGGLGIGITALVEAFSAVAASAEMVGSYFADLDAAYSQGGYRHSTKTMKDGTEYDVMEPIPGAVITTLDLQNKQLTFDSQYIYSNHYAGWGDPSMTLDKAKAINIREGIGYPNTKGSFDYDNTTLILPTTLKSYLRYDYDALPFVIYRHDRGFDIARRLEEGGRFDFDFSTLLMDKVICKLRPEYMETSIKVILDKQNQDILVPQLPKDIKGKLSYQLEGNGGEYRISLQDGVSLSLQSDSSNTSWVLDTRQLDSVEIDIQENMLKVGNVEITLPDESCGTISVIDSKNAIFAIDRENKEKILLEINDSQFTDWQALHEHLKNHSHSGDHNSFVAVDNYQPVNGGGNVGRAFYDVIADRFIYTNKPEWSEFLSSAVLAKAEGDKAWFYRKTEIWQVEIATGKILRQYLPFNGFDMKFINSSVLQHDNQLYMVIKQKLGNDNVTYTYHVEDEALKLVAIDGNTALIAELENSKGKNLSSISVVPSSNHWLSRGLTSYDHQVEATLADVVKISDWWLFCDENGVKDFVKANAEPEDLMLVFVSEHAGYFFYSNKEHSIYFQKDNGLSGTQATAVNVNNVKSIFSHNQKHFALTYEGTLWSLDDQGIARLAGVTADWLSHHRENLIKDLGQLADNTDSKFNILLLLGVQDSNGNSVNAWYDNIDDLVIQGGPNLNAEHNLTYLGLANDNKQAWIFDANDQAIYRQPLKDLVLDEKLVLTIPGDSAELFHPEQKYVNVVRDGTNLRMETADGAILLMPMNSDLAEKPTLIAFHVKEHEPAQILSALQALIDDYELPPAIRLLIKSDQEPAWYLTEEKKIIHGNGLEAGHFLHYLGKAAGLESWYIHDQNTGKLWLVSSDQSAIVGNYSFIHLDQDNLILQVSEATPSSLPQLQEASNLIISNKVLGDYLLDSSLLKHYQQIVIDDQAIIQFDPGSESTFSLQRSDKDIILHYDSFNTDILISDIEQSMQRGIVFKVCDTQLPLNQLLTELDNNNNYLELTISEGQLLVDGEFVDDGDSYLSDSGYESLTTHDYSDSSILNNISLL